jgi:hypothetical protein
MSHRFTLSIGAGCLFLAVAGAARAAVTTLADYRLGENDAGAGNAVAGNTTTTDISGNSLDLTKSGTTATYSSSVSPSATTHTGSSLAMDFGPANNSFYSLPTSLTTATSNWGMEAWVTATSTADADIVYNGTPAANGMGLIVNSGKYMGLLGGRYVTLGPAVSIGTPVHLAMVVDGTTSTFYVDGAAPLSSNNPLGVGPFAASGGFSIGGRVDSSNFFNGQIDEVRVFTFAPGAFSTNDLLINAPPVPEPATLMLLPLAGLIAIRRRHRRPSDCQRVARAHDCM